MTRTPRTLPTWAPLALLALSCATWAAARAEEAPGALPVEAARPLEIPHARVREAPPRSWKHLFGETRPITVFWDGIARFGVEAQVKGEWRRLAESAGSGWTTPPLPRGTALRFVDASGARSGSLFAPSVSSPAELSALASKRRLLVGRDVVDIELDEQGMPWVATLGGGLAYVHPERGQVRNFAETVGLPSNRVVAVAPDGLAVWVGTAGGLARLAPAPGQEGLDFSLRRYRVDRLLDSRDGLPDDYVQALALDGGRLWIGTYRGLALLEDGRIRRVHEPWSVFSLMRGTDGRIWEGYEGLRGLPDAEPIEGVPSDLDVYDVEVLPGSGTLLATLQEGLVQLHEGQRTPLWDGSGEDGAYAIARVADLYLVAGGEGGMITLDGRGEVARRWTLADGLPSETVNEVVPDLPRGAELQGGVAERAWIGTRRGLATWTVGQEAAVALPVSPMAAGKVPTSVSRKGRRLFFAGEEGLDVVGPSGHLPRRGDAGPLDLVAVFMTGSTTWWVHPDRVVQDRAIGRDRVYKLPFPVSVATLHRGVVWIGGAGGACRYDDRAKNFLPVPNLGPVRRLRSAPDGVLWAIASETVTAVQPDLTVKPYLRTRRPLDLSPDGEIVWVGTVRGIEVLQPRTGEVADVLRTADKFVKIPAIAADGRGGVWAATDAGNVLHLATSGRDLGATLFDLDPYEPPNVLEILPEGHWGAWALTDQGPWALTRPR